MIDMSKQMKKKTWDLETLLKILQDELEARERVAPEAKLISESNFHTQRRRVPAQGKRNMSTASALFASVLDMYVFLDRYGYLCIFVWTNMIFKTDISISIQPKP